MLERLRRDMTQKRLGNTALVDRTVLVQGEAEGPGSSRAHCKINKYADQVRVGCILRVPCLINPKILGVSNSFLFVVDKDGMNEHVEFFHNFKSSFLNANIPYTNIT